MLSEDELREAILLVFANKQDLPNAMDCVEVTDRLGLHSPALPRVKAFTKVLTGSLPISRRQVKTTNLNILTRKIKQVRKDGCPASDP